MEEIDKLYILLEFDHVDEETTVVLRWTIFKPERKWEDAKIQFSENRSIEKELRVQSQGGDQAAHRAEQSVRGQDCCKAKCTGKDTYEPDRGSGINAAERSVGPGRDYRCTSWGAGGWRFARRDAS